jgi:flagellar protein FliL
LGGRNINPGNQLANIDNMPEEQLSDTLENAPKSASKKKREWLAVVLALAVGAAGIFVWLRPAPSTSVAGGAAAESTIVLETFVVNLDGSGSRAYLRTGITLGLVQAFPRNKSEAVPVALVRDTILSVLSTAQPAELLKPEGKRELKEKLLRALQERVPQMSIVNVYFTEFLVQM